MWELLTSWTVAVLKPNLSMKDILEKAKEIEKQQKQQTIEEVFEWLTKNNIEQFKNQ
jgi:hypothetical protein